MRTHPYLELPDPDEFRRRCRQRAVLEIICVGSEYPDSVHLTYRDAWRPDSALASWADQMGFEWTAVFSPEGAYLRGFARDSPMNPLHWQRNRLWEGIIDDLPAQFRPYLTDPDVDSTFRFFEGDLDTEIPQISLCAWRLPSDRSWQCSDYPEPDDEDEDIECVEYLFRDIVEWSPDQVADELGDYYGRPIARHAVAAVLAEAPLTPDLIRAISPQADVDRIVELVAPTGYPRPGASRTVWS